MLGTGDHKVIGRLYIVTALVFGIAIVVLGGLLGFEATAPGTIDVFTSSTVFQSFTLFRVSSVFLLAIPLVLGVAMAIVPLQVGARSIAFPRAAAASYWGWLMGSILLLVSYAINGGPAGGRSSGVNLFLASFGLVVVSIVVAAIALATTVLALRHTGLSLSRTPLFAWSVAVASIMWVPAPAGARRRARAALRRPPPRRRLLGGNAAIYSRLPWCPQPADLHPRRARARLRRPRHHRQGHRRLAAWPSAPSA
ncbi:MAG: cbb3-type cytochrome c oxidase subunit I [Acidimicrobiales bacterium]